MCDRRGDSTMPQSKAKVSATERYVFNSSPPQPQTSSCRCRDGLQRAMSPAKPRAPKPFCQACKAKPGPGIVVMRAPFFGLTTLEGNLEPNKSRRGNHWATRQNRQALPIRPSEAPRWQQIGRTTIALRSAPVLEYLNQYSSSQGNWGIRLRDCAGILLAQFPKKSKEPFQQKLQIWLELSACLPLPYPFATGRLTTALP